MNWIKVEPNPADNDVHPERLPPLEKVVAIIYLNNYDDGDIFALGGRTDDGEGWLWATLNDTRGYRRDGKHVDFIVEDDYRVTHWAEIEWPED